MPKATPDPCRLLRNISRYAVLDLLDRGRATDALGRSPTAVSPVVGYAVGNVPKLRSLGNLTLTLTEAVALDKPKYEQTDPDVRLMLQVRDGSAAAFEELVLRYQSRLITLLQNLVHSDDKAEELAQDVFLSFTERGTGTCRRRSSPRGCSPSRKTSPATPCVPALGGMRSTWRSSKAAR